MKRAFSKTFTIDGRQLISGVHGGVQRFMLEILLELDKIAEPGEYEICIPNGSKLETEFKNIPVVEHGKLNGLLWEQISLPGYLRKNHRFGIYPCSVVPFFYCRGMAIIHDIMFKTVPMVAKSIHPTLRLLMTGNYAVATKHADLIGTVTEYSKNEIIQTYHIDPSRIVVINNAWQHFERVPADEGWIKDHPEIQPGEYYFSLSANRIQKNYKWIYEVAKRNPKRMFLMAGEREEWQKQQEYDAPNLKHLGFVSDEVVRALMEHCKAFLFPSFYEGFGIPPLEALSVGAEIIVAKSSCLPEVYQDSAHYIDPNDYDIDLDALLLEKVAPPEKALSRFSWARSAQKLNEARRIILDGQR